MATIQTRFNIGDTAVTIDPKTLKKVEFKVGQIVASKSAKTSTCSLYPLNAKGELDIYTSYDEDKCFVTSKELLDYTEIASA